MMPETDPPPSGQTPPVAALQPGPRGPSACDAERSLSPPSPPQARPARHPLGPIIVTHPLDNPVFGRLYACGVLAAVSLSLVMASRLNPGGRTLGTHQQLGLPPCGFLQITGLPCPTCGMTTAYAYTVRGQWLRAVRAQPAGFLLALLTIAAGLASIYTVAAGRYPSVNWYRVNPVHLVWWLAVFALGAWAFEVFVGLATGVLPARRLD